MALAGSSRAIDPPRFHFREKRATVSASAPSSYWLLLAFLFLLYANLPMMYPALDAVRPAKVIAGLGLAALVGEALTGRRRLVVPWPEGYLLLGFVIAAALSSIAALWPRLALESSLDLAKMAIVYYFIANVADTKDRLRGVMWTIVIGGLFPTLGALKGYAAGEVLEGRAVWIGIFSNPTELAYALVILIPIAAALMTRASLVSRLVLAGMIVMYLAAIAVSFSRGGLVGLAAVGAIYAWRQKTLWMRVAVVIAMAGALFYATRHWSRSEGFSNLKSDNSFQQRIATSKVGLAIFADHPVFGVGLGCSVVAWPLYAPKDLYSRGSLVTHNTLIQPLSETGIAGFVTFCTFIGFSLFYARRLTVFGPALETALWGFVVCGLSGGYVLTWFPYILTGMVSAARRIREAN
jgi:putative inorganic carbon (hco3(-)) transporter